MVLLDVSSNDFAQKREFDHFDLILSKHLPRKISFSNFVYLLVDRTTYHDSISKKFQYFCSCVW